MWQDEANVGWISEAPSTDGENGAKAIASSTVVGYLRNSINAIAVKVGCVRSPIRQTAPYLSSASDAPYISGLT